MISDERLEQFAHDKRMCNVTEEIVSMARELLAYRKELIPEEFLNARQNDKGMFEISEDCMCKLFNILCRSPNA